MLPFLCMLFIMYQIGSHHSRFNMWARNGVGKILFYHQTCNGCCPGRSKTYVLDLNRYCDFGVVLWGKCNKNSVVFSMWILSRTGLTTDLTLFAEEYTPPCSTLDYIVQSRYGQFNVCF